MAYKDSDYIHLHDHYHEVTKPYNFSAENHLGGGDTSAFVVQSAARRRPPATAMGG